MGFPVSKTMRTAQKLYEEGHITYMRTDSVTLSNEAKKAVKSKILNEFGEKYLCERTYTNKSKTLNKLMRQLDQLILKTKMFLLTWIKRSCMI